jgi:hypothetical protein
MAPHYVRKIGWFLIGDLALIACLVGLGLALNAMKIQRGNNFVTDMLGPHGLVFDVVLPLAVYSDRPCCRNLGCCLGGFNFQEIESDAGLRLD